MSSIKNVSFSLRELQKVKCWGKNKWLNTSHMPLGYRKSILDDFSSLSQLSDIMDWESVK